MARVLQKDLGDIFLHDTKGHFDKAFITVTQVRVSPDMSIANVYLSFLLAKDKDGMLESIREKGKLIRTALGNRIRHQVRIVPELRFFADDTAEQALKLQNLIDTLNVPKLKPEEEE